MERSSALGGAAASGLGLLGFMDRQGRKSLGGLPQEFVDRLQNMHGAIGHFKCPVHNSITPLSPDMFKKYMVPLYKQVTDFLHSHDIDVIHVDCDGNIDELIPL